MLQDMNTTKTIQKLETALEQIDFRHKMTLDVLNEHPSTSLDCQEEGVSDAKMPIQIHSNKILHAD